MRIVRHTALGIVLLARAAVAQGSATISGRVVSKASQGAVVGAEVHLAPAAKRALTDAEGRFRFERVAPGRVAIRVKQIGFAPESALVDVHENEDLDVLVQLEALVQQLDTVTVAGREDPLAKGKLAGFYERKRFGIGRFFDSELLEKEKNRRLGEFITSRTPGSKLIRSHLGMAAWLATRRIGGGLVLLGGSTLTESDLNAGADPRACYPDVYVDGALLYAHGTRTSLFDINSYSTNDVVAVEFYVSASQIPVQFNKTGAACGVAVLWTR